MFTRVTVVSDKGSTFVWFFIEFMLASCDCRPMLHEILC